MYVQGIQCINFGRKPSDMKDYSDTLRKAKMKVGNGGKSERRNASGRRI